MKRGIIKCSGFKNTIFKNDSFEAIYTDENGIEKSIYAIDKDVIEDILVNQERIKNDEMYLSISSTYIDEKEIFKIEKVANEEIYNQYNELLTDYNLGKIDVIYNDKTKSLLEMSKGDYSPSIDWQKEIDYER